MPSTAAWVDTGFLVALFASDDQHHESAVAFLEANAPRLDLHSIWPVVSEASFFLGATGKDALLQWLEKEPITFHDCTVGDLPGVRATLRKYRDLEPDFADALLVTLATKLGIDGIITVDLRDFSAYRLGKARGFRRLWL